MQFFMRISPFPLSNYTCIISATLPFPLAFHFLLSLQIPCPSFFLASYHSSRTCVTPILPSCHSSSMCSSISKPGAWGRVKSKPYHHPSCLKTRHLTTPPCPSPPRLGFSIWPPYLFLSPSCLILPRPASPCVFIVLPQQPASPYVFILLPRLLVRKKKYMYRYILKKIMLCLDPPFPLINSITTIYV